MKNLILLVLITLIFQNVIYSQKSSIQSQDIYEFKTKSTNLSVDYVIDLIKDNNQNEVIVYSNFNGLKEIKEGNSIGFKTGDFLDGIVFKDGTKFEFSENETYLFSIEDKVYTSKLDFLNSLKHIYIYKLKENSLEKTDKELSIPIYFSINNILNSDFLLFSNQYELVGDSVKIYDKNLNVIKEFTFYKDGFNRMLYSGFGEKIIVITTPNISTPENKGFRVSLIDTQDNFSIQKTNFHDEINPVKIFPFENNFALISNGEIRLLDEQRKINWTKSLNVSSSAFSTVAKKEENKLFVIAEGCIVCLSISDGQEIWRINLKELYPYFEEPKSIKNEYYAAYFPRDFQLLNSINVIGLLSAKSEQDYSKGTVKYSDKYLTLINYSGEVIQHFTLNDNKQEYKVQSKNIPLKLFMQQNEIIIFNNGEVVRIKI